MQTIIGFDSLANDPVTHKGVTSIVVVDDFGNPIWALQTISGGAIFIASAKDAKFKEIVSALGYGLRVPEVKVLPNERS